MLLDKFLQVSNAQAVTVSAASTDLIDFEQPNPNLGIAGGMFMAITLNETAESAGAATVNFEIQDCDTFDGTYKTVAASGAIGKAALVVGKVIYIPMPLEHRQFVRLYYTVGTADLTKGKFTANLTNSIQANIAHPAGMGDS